MLIIEDDILYLTRGDDATFSVIIKDSNGVTYEMVPGETLTMTVREFPSEESDVLFQIISETNEFQINHSDTADLEVGKYSCDIQLNDRYGKIHTVYPIVDVHGKIRNWKNFILDPEVTIP